MRRSSACATCASRLTSCSIAAPMAKRIDRGRIAAAGHSYGANTVMLAAGATLQRNGHSVEFRDPRIRAALLLSAPPFYGEAAQDRILGHAHTARRLHVTATEDVIRVPGYYSRVLDDRVWPCSTPTGSRIKTLAVFEGGSHSIFTDRAGTVACCSTRGSRAPRRSWRWPSCDSVFDAQDDAHAAVARQVRRARRRWVHLGRDSGIASGVAVRVAEVVPPIRWRGAAQHRGLRRRIARAPEA